MACVDPVVSLPKILGCGLRERSPRVLLLRRAESTRTRWSEERETTGAHIAPTLCPRKVPPPASTTSTTESSEGLHFGPTQSRGICQRPRPIVRVYYSASQAALTGCPSPRGSTSVRLSKLIFRDERGACHTPKITQGIFFPTGVFFRDTHPLFPKSPFLCCQILGNNLSTFSSFFN